MKKQLITKIPRQPKTQFLCEIGFLLSLQENIAEHRQNGAQFETCFAD
jgi:hypothetical protein